MSNTKQQRSVKDELAMNRVRELFSNFPYSGAAGIEGHEINTLSDIADNLERLSGTVDANAKRANAAHQRLVEIDNDLRGFGRILARIKAILPKDSVGQKF